MLFCSWTFGRFFLIVFAVYWLIPWRRLCLRLSMPGGNRGDALPELLPGANSERPWSWSLTGDEVRVWWLVAASFYFYAAWNSRLALLICATTLMDYFIALTLEALQRPRLRLGLLVLSLVANLGVLTYFKYANFFLESFYDSLGWVRDHDKPLLNILLPVGISFYTFEAINYTVDVYQRRIRAERNPIHLLFFILFFPHLIAGPIVRARDFLPQIRRSKRWSWGRLQLGGEYFLLGLLKKWVVADQLAYYADPVFASPGVYSTAANWLGLLAFTVQVYCDISGYSDMALGLAHVFGYKLSINFNMPYLAVNVGDYWRRDHISLSTWLRDYLFIPLGGSRGTDWKVSRNFLITMTLGGLWHGASWNFVLWGILHGVYLSVHRIFRKFCEARPRLDGLLQSVPGTALRMALTFFCIYQGFVLFRATTFTLAAEMLHRLWVPADGAAIVHPYGYGFFWTILIGFVLFHVAAVGRWWERVSLRLPSPVLSCGYVLALILCMVLAPMSEKPFIYFQF
jgi:alginate O-acetyltransferase complex protein AlgI